MKKITFISDTHANYKCEKDLPGGDIIVHAGDFMTSGHSVTEAEQFFNWFSSLRYDHKIFISGNHDRIMQAQPEKMRKIIDRYDINYLEDESITIDDIKFYGSPWQPEFFNWAFNLPRGGKELEDKWNAIPEDTDVLITHGPPSGFGDFVSGVGHGVGCELLRKRIDEIKPKILVCGHIHQSNGYYKNLDTHIINASVLGENYFYTYSPANVEWDPNTNELLY